MWITARQPSAGSLSQWNDAKVMKTNSQRNLLAIALGPGESKSGKREMNEEY
jgi:hypothetical protein